MSEKLLPCPFCGAPADPPELYGESKTAMFIACSGCGANIYHGTADKEANRAAAIAAWNRRVPPSPDRESGGWSKENPRNDGTEILGYWSKSDCHAIIFFDGKNENWWTDSCDGAAISAPEWWKPLDKPNALTSPNRPQSTEEKS